MDDVETAAAAAQIMLTSPNVHDGDHVMGLDDDVMPQLSSAADDDDNELSQAHALTDTLDADVTLSATPPPAAPATHDVSNNPLHDYQPNGEHMSVALAANTTDDDELNLDSLLNTQLANDVTSQHNASAAAAAVSQQPPSLSMAVTPTSQPPTLPHLPNENQVAAPAVPSVICCGCQQPIRERYLLNAVNTFWHEACLKCSCCGCRLGDVGSSLYTRSNLLLCKRDYLRLFGASGQCAVCKQTIPGFEMVMRVKDTVYHVECFKCQQCRQRLNVGDKFYLCEGRVLCEYDFEEQNLITSIQRGLGGYNALSHMRKQTHNLTSGGAAVAGSSFGYAKHRNLHS